MNENSFVLFRTKYHYSSPHDDELDGSLHNHQPQFLMSPEAKLFQNHPGSFNFQMAALAADPAALASNCEYFQPLTDCSLKLIGPFFLLSIHF